MVLTVEDLRKKEVDFERQRELDMTFKNKEKLKRIKLAEEKRLDNDKWYQFIIDTFKKHGIQVDKFGHVSFKGGYYIDQIVKPQFTDIEFSFAMNLAAYGRLEEFIKKNE